MSMGIPEGDYREKLVTAAAYLTARAEPTIAILIKIES